MDIRAILLGSAAALTAVNSAWAADAIDIYQPEPEPMEYVKVCDMYGAGFHYIPGTETCININGYVRSTYSHGKETVGTNLTVGGAIVTAAVTSSGFVTAFTNGDTSGPATVVAPGVDLVRNTSRWSYRGRINFDVRNETEFGTLRSFLRIQGGDSDASGDANVGIDTALIELAGFRLGYAFTYWETNHDSGAGSPAINDGFYSSDQALFFDYTARLMDGVAVTVGVQDSNGGAFGASSPDFYVGMNASFGGLTVAATAIRDDYVDVNTGNTKDEWAYKVSAIGGFGDSGWQVGGWYAKDDGHTQYVSGYYANDIDEEWGLQVNGELASNLSVYGLYSEASGEANAAALAAVDTEFDLTQWSVGAVWAPVSQLAVQLEYSETETEISTSAAPRWSSDNESFNVRVTRSF